MSKYVKELMMDQLRTDLGASTSVLILDLKGLDAISEFQLRRDLRKKKIRLRALKNTLAKRVFSEMGIGGLSRYLEGPSVAAWGGDGVAELAKEVSTRVKTLKKPEIKGGAVDGVVIGPQQVEEITRLPSREVLIGQVIGLLLGPAREVVGLLSSPGNTLAGQLEALAERHGGEGGGVPAPAPEPAPAPAPEG